MNNKVFSNLDVDPKDTFTLAVTESTLWTEVNVAIPAKTVPHNVDATLLQISGRWCFRDGFWKDNDFFWGQNWYSTLADFDGLMGQEMLRLAFFLFARR